MTPNQASKAYERLDAIAQDIVRELEVSFEGDCKRITVTRVTKLEETLTSALKQIEDGL